MYYVRAEGICIFLEPKTLFGWSREKEKGCIKGLMIILWLFSEVIKLRGAQEGLGSRVVLDYARDKL